MRSKGAKLLAFAAVLGLLAAACGGETREGRRGGQDGGGTITIAGDEANDHGTEKVTGDSVEVELDDNYFEPTIIEGQAGAHLALDLHNEGSALHNVTIEDQDVDQDVDAGGHATVHATIPDSGVVQFYCKYHKGQGMVGGLRAA